MTEHVEEAELTVEDILNDADKVEFHPILRVWQEILDSSKQVRQERITPRWALRVITSHPEMHFADMTDYRDLYFQSIDELAEALKVEIETDDECLKYTSAEEDAEKNTFHYLNVIIAWQKIILTWELDWDVEAPDAPVQLAVISEVHKMFFGEVGLTSLLDQINFEFTEDSQNLLRAELEELKENWANDE
jgi:hypothetical protein